MKRAIIIPIVVILLCTFVLALEPLGPIFLKGDVAETRSAITGRPFYDGGEGNDFSLRLLSSASDGVAGEPYTIEVKVQSNEDKFAGMNVECGVLDRAIHPWIPDSDESGRAGIVSAQAFTQNCVLSEGQVKTYRVNMDGGESTTLSFSVIPAYSTDPVIYCLAFEACHNDPSGGGDVRASDRIIREIDIAVPPPEQQTCTNECSATLDRVCKSDSNDVYRCAQFDSDPCLDFGLEIRCPSGTTCTEGGGTAFCQDPNVDLYIPEEPADEEEEPITTDPGLVRVELECFTCVGNQAVKSDPPASSREVSIFSRAASDPVCEQLESEDGVETYHSTEPNCVNSEPIVSDNFKPQIKRIGVYNNDGQPVWVGDRVPEAITQEWRPGDEIEVFVEIDNSARNFDTAAKRQEFINKLCPEGGSDCNTFKVGGEIIRDGIDSFVDGTRAISNSVPILGWVLDFANPVTAVTNAIMEHHDKQIVDTAEWIDVGVVELAFYGLDAADAAYNYPRFGFDQPRFVDLETIRQVKSCKPGEGDQGYIQHYEVLFSPKIDGECLGLNELDRGFWDWTVEQVGGVCNVIVKTKIKVPEEGDTINNYDGTAAESNYDEEGKYYLHAAVFDRCYRPTHAPTYLVKKAAQVQLDVEEIQEEDEGGFLFCLFNDCNDDDCDGVLNYKDKIDDKMCPETPDDDDDDSSNGGGSQPSCNDGKLNNGETGTDCGGPCPACQGTCGDGMKNNGETGIDCGGPCSQACFCCEAYWLTESRTAFELTAYCGETYEFSLEFGKVPLSWCTDVDEQICCELSDGSPAPTTVYECINHPGIIRDSDDAFCEGIEGGDCCIANDVARFVGEEGTCKGDLSFYRDDCDHFVENVAYPDKTSSNKYCVAIFNEADKCYNKKESIDLRELGDLDDFKLEQDKRNIEDFDEYVALTDEPICVAGYGDIQCDSDGECLPAINSNRDSRKDNLVVYEALEPLIEKGWFDWLLGWTGLRDASIEQRVESYGVCVFQERDEVNVLKRWVADLLGYDDPESTEVMVAIVVMIAGAGVLLYFLAKPPQKKKPKQSQNQQLQDIFGGP